LCSKERTLVCSTEMTLVCSKEVTLVCSIMQQRDNVVQY
jgi:hypothetical protein